MPTDNSDSIERNRRAAYSEAYPKFLATLTAAERKSLEDADAPDFQGNQTFALPVRADDAAYTSDPDDPVIQTLEELKTIDGALPKIALWINDQTGGLEVIKSMEQFRIALDRICKAKNPRLEGYLVSLAIGMNLLGNANGFAIASHFGIRPQTFHESLSETCKALGVEKPLSKVNTERYASTQYRHNVKGSKC